VDRALVEQDHDLSDELGRNLERERILWLTLAAIDQK
jgi:hypothetical protein